MTENSPHVPVRIERSARPVGAARLGRLARDLLEASTLCAIATVSSGRRAHVNTAYFAWSDRLDLVWLSAPQAQHSVNVRKNPSVAVSVYDSSQSWGKPDRGIQLFGRAREVAGAAADEAAGTYAGRFPGYREWEFEAYRFYRLRPQRVKLFDERALGPGVFVTARVNGGRLAWTRTEIYRGGSGR
jgi:uncharacterized protein YhbP (UPF0306 family)